ncbi:MAG TPA: membrane dipeptidase [Stellaceae bacterium]|nr:membrane dipeptidase [Stellaceae bacterium]
MRLDWPGLKDGRADALDGAEVEILGWMAPVEVADVHDYFLLTPEPICCIGCLPSDPTACLEIFAETPLPPRGRPARLVGQLRRLVDDPAGWRYQLRAARLVEESEPAVAVTRRGVIAAGATLALAAYAGPGAAAQAQTATAARALVDAHLTVDIHSHAGRIINPNAPLGGVADPMREGGMSVICLAMVADRPVTKVGADRRISAIRQPAPGELYAWSQTAFARVQILARSEKLAVVTDAASLQAAQKNGPAVVVAAEGADFLDTSVDRVEEAYRKYGLRHLQLTHYRVNDLGDIQTETPVHDGLTDFGAEVIRACNRLGVVVDVAHGTYDLVKRAAKVTTKPLVLSHTSLTGSPRPLTRLITSDHARVIADTGGVIGIWPPSTVFPDLAAMAVGIARMVAVVGVDHVGLGSDMLGLTSPSVFDSYRDLPALAQALLTVGFGADETAKILGGNYARVFAQTVG